jgi:hypothetical protein
VTTQVDFTCPPNGPNGEHLTSEHPARLEEDDPDGRWEASGPVGDVGAQHSITRPRPPRREHRVGCAVVRPAR